MARSHAECVAMVDAFAQAAPAALRGLLPAQPGAVYESEELVETGRIGQMTGVSYRFASASHRRTDAGQSALETASRGGGRGAVSRSRLPHAGYSGLPPRPARRGRRRGGQSGRTLRGRGLHRHAFPHALRARWARRPGTSSAASIPTSSRSPARRGRSPSRPSATSRCVCARCRERLPPRFRGRAQRPEPERAPNSRRRSFDLPNPLHIQQPLIQTIVDELHGKGLCPSTGVTASRTALVMDTVLNGFYGGRRGRLLGTPRRPGPAAVRAKSAANVRLQPGRSSAVSSAFSAPGRTCTAPTPAVPNGCVRRGGGIGAADAPDGGDAESGRPGKRHQAASTAGTLRPVSASVQTMASR